MRLHLEICLAAALMLLAYGCEKECTPIRVLSSSGKMCQAETTHFLDAISKGHPFPQLNDIRNSFNGVPAFYNDGKPSMYDGIAAYWPGVRRRHQIRRGSENGEGQQFWNALLGDVLGMEDVVSRVQYQVPVPMKGTTKFLDAWMPISLPTSTAGNGIICAMERKS